MLWTITNKWIICDFRTYTVRVALFTAHVMEVFILPYKILLFFLYTELLSLYYLAKPFFYFSKYKRNMSQGMTNCYGVRMETVKKYRIYHIAEVL